MDKVVYTWPEDTAIPPKDIDLEKDSCYTCRYAIITIIGECTKWINGEYAHQGGYCPSTWWCKYYQRADDFTIGMNSFDWTKAIRIDVWIFGLLSAR